MVFSLLNSLTLCSLYKSVKSIFLMNLTKIGKYSLISFAFAIGQVPPVCFIYFINSFLWAVNFVHWTIKCCIIWSSLSSHGHFGLLVNPNRWRYFFIFPCPVIIIVNSGNPGIFVCSLLLADGKKALVTAPLPVFFYCFCRMFSPYSFSRVVITSRAILAYAIGPYFRADSFARLSSNSFPSIPACPLIHPKCITHLKFSKSVILFRINSINRFRLNGFCKRSKVILLSVYSATCLS